VALFKDFFHFNSLERKGIYAFLLFGMLVFVGNSLLLRFQAERELERTEEELRDLLASIEVKTDAFSNHNNNHFYENNSDALSAVEYFDFDPNNLSVTKWMELGLSKKQAEVIKSYEAKGGSFRVKSDLEKMYTISEKHYRALLPYILLPDTIKRGFANFDNNKTPNREAKRWEKVTVDINIADSMALLKVYGLGPFYSGKIISYREALGGYHNKEQLLEIWRFSDSMLQALDSNLLLNKVKLRKLNINAATAEELKNHPYISWNIANSIVNLRKQHGAYKNLEDIKQSVLIGDSTYQKISPYLSVKNDE